jgi:hypothetical protein
MTWLVLSTMLLSIMQDFVNTMKTQLGSTAGFNMPDHYFVITREQMDHAPSGQYYSKITRKDIT